MYPEEGHIHQLYQCVMWCQTGRAAAQKFYLLRPFRAINGQNVKSFPDSGFGGFGAGRASIGLSLFFSMYSFAASLV